MRKRTTWNREEVIAKAAALAKKADPYTMNQDHPQPAADAYTNGDPSSWAEDIHPAKGTWEAEYTGDQVKRDEIGMPEMRGDTFSHPEKTASVEKKAAVCVSLSRRILKNASEEMIEDQALGFMELPDSVLVATFARVTAQQEDKEEEKEQQAKQAQDQQQADKEEQQKKQAQAQQEQGKDQGEKTQDKQAQQEQSQQEDKKDQKQANQQQMVSADQVQSMVQSAVQAAMQQMLQAQGQQGQPQMQAQQQQPQMAATVSDDQLLDQLLMEDQGQDQGMAEMGIEMDAPMMDVEAALGPEDSVLISLFANDESKAQEQIEQGEEQGQKQASVRTASSRTVGTRPTAGVSRLGGSPSSGSGHKSSEEANLTALWKTEPDVSDIFRR